MPWLTISTVSTVKFTKITIFSRLFQKLEASPRAEMVTKQFLSFYSVVVALYPNFFRMAIFRDFRLMNPRGDLRFGQTWIFRDKNAAFQHVLCCATMAKIMPSI